MINNVIHQIIAAIEIPYAIILVYALIVVAKKKCFLLVSIVLFMIAWRSFFEITSSRYCISFLILACILAGKVHKNRNIHAKEITLVLVLLAYNSIKTFSSYNNKYIIDLKDIIEKKIEDDPNCYAYINDKDYKRIISDNQTVSKQEIFFSFYNDSYEKDVPFYESVDTLLNDTYFAFSDRNNGLDLNNTVPQYTKVAHMITNKKGSSYSVYLRKGVNPVSLIESNNDSMIQEILSTSRLVGYNPKYDSYAFQSNNKITWLIGHDFDSKVEIIFHVFPMDNSLLPEERKEVGYENLGSTIQLDSLKKNNNYYIVSKEIPSRYDISKIRTGFFVGNQIIWSCFFSPNSSLN